MSHKYVYKRIADTSYISSEEFLFRPIQLVSLLFNLVVPGLIPGADNEIPRDNYRKCLGWTTFGLLQFGEISVGKGVMSQR